MQDIELLKSQLEIGNDEQKDQLLRTTDEHGTLLFSIKNLYEKIARRNEQNGYEIHFNRGLDDGERRDGEGIPAFGEQDCLRQLDYIKTYISGFNDFRAILGDKEKDEAASTNSVPVYKKNTYFQKMVAELEIKSKMENSRVGSDDVQDFIEFDPSTR